MIQGSGPRQRAAAIIPPRSGAKLKIEFLALSG